MTTTTGGSRLFFRFSMISMYSLLIQFVLYYKQNQGGYYDDHHDNRNFLNHQSTRRTLSTKIMVEELGTEHLNDAKLNNNDNNNKLSSSNIRMKQVLLETKNEDIEEIPIVTKTTMTATTAAATTPSTIKKPGITNNNIDNKYNKQKLQTILDRNYIETGSVFRISSSSSSDSNYNNNTNNNNITIISNKLVNSSTVLWNHSELIPTWMKEYFDWHKEKRKHVTESNWNQHNWIVMSCLDGIDQHCGGIADRIKPFLNIIRYAYEMDRILIIYWTKPMELENFLLPPIGGIDWRAPTWFKTIIQDHAKNDDEGIIKKALSFLELDEMNITDYDPILYTKCQSMTGGEEPYEEKRIIRNLNHTNNQYKEEEVEQERSFRDIYHDVWRIFFTPTEPIANIITNEMNRMGLVPGGYVAAHLRALYGRVTSRSIEQTIEWTQNALNCASNLHPGGPIFFSSELIPSIEAALDYNYIVQSQYGSTTRIVARNQNTTTTKTNNKGGPLHFEKMEMGGIKKKTNPGTLLPSDLYETFIDLYLIGMSSCVTYGSGGFGQLGLLISSNVNCYKKQKTGFQKIGVRCNWTEPVLLSTIGNNNTQYTTIQTEKEKKISANSKVIPPLFLQPMI